MTMRHITTTVIVCSAILFAACNRVPDNVLQPEPMAELLADLYVADRVVETNQTMFYRQAGNDSMRKVLKQSILHDHGVTQEMLDTSYMYYGHHLDDYVEIHDRVLEILTEKMSHSDAALAQAGFSVAGDSVDTWPGAMQLVLSRRSPQQTVTFTLQPDENWQKGDQYLWSVKSLNMRQPGQWVIAADYPGGITETQRGQFQGEGRNQLRLLTDSTCIPDRIYGSITLNPVAGEIIYIDSITLTRKRVDPLNYRLRHRQQRISTARQDAAATQMHTMPVDARPETDEQLTEAGRRPDEGSRRERIVSATTTITPQHKKSDASALAQ